MSAELPPPPPLAAAIVTEVPESVRVILLPCTTLLMTPEGEVIQLVPVLVASVNELTPPPPPPVPAGPTAPADTTPAPLLTVEPLETLPLAPELVRTTWVASVTLATVK